MKSTYPAVLICFSFLFLSCSSEVINPELEINPDADVEELYFPPINSTDWEAASLTQLNWQEDEVEELSNFLDTSNTKGFMVLYNGRIIIEKYFNNHSQDETWFWNSAAKTFTAVATGIAQDEGFLDLNDKTSDYLGTDWSTLSTEQEDLITVQHHLSMSTGLDDKVDQFIAWTCTQRICLEYETVPGTRWAYHQGAYSLLFDIVEDATATDFYDYGKEKIEDKIGMIGSWSELGALKRYESDTRSMARFGLLMLNEGVWNSETLLSKDYFNEMVSTSQNMNPSYGYLWWLNGKTSYMGTTSQEVFTGSLIPNAPSDMYSALGANDQKIYVVPSENLVIIRTGDSANEAQLGPSSYDNELWEKINAVINN